MRLCTKFWSILLSKQRNLEIKDCLWYNPASSKTQIHSWPTIWEYMVFNHIIRCSSSDWICTIIMENYWQSWVPRGPLVEVKMSTTSQRVELKTRSFCQRLFPSSQINTEYASNKLLCTMRHPSISSEKHKHADCPPAIMACFWLHPWFLPFAKNHINRGHKTWVSPQWQIWCYTQLYPTFDVDSQSFLCVCDG